MKKTVYESNYARLRSLFGSDVEGFPPYLRFEAAGFMPLTFDRLQIQNGTTQYAMTHWYEQHGDLIPDPEMIIEFRGESVEAISIQHPPPFNRIIPVYSEDRTRYSPSEKRSQNQFLSQWLRNIKDQGFKRVEP